MEMGREIQVSEEESDDNWEDAEDVVIDVELLNSMKEKLASPCAKSSPLFTICRVPAQIRDSDGAAYTPSIISIGPFHRQSKSLQAMEEHKWRYLHKVLSRSEPENDLEKYLKEMRAKEEQARNCYSEDFTMKSDEFVEMMVLDGCFVLQFIHEQELQNNDVRKNDPIYRNKWMFDFILHDMLLLENQLPFFVLELLWELIGQPRATLRKEALTFLHRAFPDESELMCTEEPDIIHHLLHAVHLSLRPAPVWTGQGPPRTGAEERGQSQAATHGVEKGQRKEDNQGRPCMGWRRGGGEGAVERGQSGAATHGGGEGAEKTLDTYNPLKMVPCAMELQEAGFRFQRKQAKSFFDVTFEKGLMKMPCLHIDDDTNALFRNFIAFEQCFPEWDNHFTSYCFLIDALVNTPRDVSILTQSNIIEHMLGSDEEVSILFNKLCKEIVGDLENSYLANVFQEVNQHTQKRWPKWRAKLVRDYFSSPWAIISLIAAIIILIVALVQTFFAVFAYFRPPKP